jgi:hypothetical protein
MFLPGSRHPKLRNVGTDLTNERLRTRTKELAASSGRDVIVRERIGMRSKTPILAWSITLIHCSALFAGMPSPLPTNYQERILRLNDSALHRLEAISFFLFVFLLCGGAVKYLWNRVQRDFPSLPRLSYGAALAGVFLWALLFVIVLTMISGARELMTPGAWKQQGFTYKLATNETQPMAQASAETSSRQHLERLRTALMTFAAMHDGKFPTTAEMTAIANELWEIPETGGMRYQYVPNLVAGHVPEVLAYAPELDSDQRLVLQTNGDILMMRSAEIQNAVSKRSQP